MVYIAVSRGIVWLLVTDILLYFLGSTAEPLTEYRVQQKQYIHIIIMLYSPTRLVITFIGLLVLFLIFFSIQILFSDFNCKRLLIYRKSLIELIKHTFTFFK